MRVPETIGQSTVRLSVGRFTTDADVARAAALLVTAVRMHGGVSV